MTKTIVEIDLKGYSDIARELEDHFSAEIVMKFNEQIQVFITNALKVARVVPKDAIMATTGDGAILMFDTPAVAHVFAEAVHHATRLHNHEKTVEAAKRWFRIGMATGNLAMDETGGTRKMAGSVIARAVRLEAASNIGEIIADAETYAKLTHEQQVCYGNEEQILGKRDESFRARRYIVLPGLMVAAAKAKLTASKPKSSPALDKWRDKLEFLQTELAIVASAAQKYELKCLIDEARQKIAELGG